MPAIKVLVEVTERWKAAADKDLSGAEKYLTRFVGDEFFLVLSGYADEAQLTDIISLYVDALGVNLTVDGAVFKKASMFFGELLCKTGAKLTLSLNASVRHMMKSDFLDEIRALLDDSGIPAEQLEIEITESIMIDSVDKALCCIDELKSMGIQIAIDDFGTGYSSLSYLNRFPANLLKIDKSFIDKMNTGDSSRQYVAAIISIGHVMGFEVISEGVEEPEQLETLTLPFVFRHGSAIRIGKELIFLNQFFDAADCGVPRQLHFRVGRANGSMTEFDSFSGVQDIVVA